MCQVKVRKRVAARIAWRMVEQAYALGRVCACASVCVVSTLVYFQPDGDVLSLTALTRPDLEIKMFPGLTSRWMLLSWCR